MRSGAKTEDRQTWKSGKKKKESEPICFSLVIIYTREDNDRFLVMALQLY